MQSPNEQSREREEPHLPTVDDAEKKRLIHVDISASIFSYGKLTTVHVGDKSKMKFNVPTDLLAIHSQYFLDQFKNLGWDVVVDLPRVTPTQFTNFVIWLHSGKTESAGRHIPRCASQYGTDMYEGLWLLGEKLGAPKFQNYSMAKICEKAKSRRLRGGSRWPNLHEAEYIVERASNGSFLHNLLVTNLAVHNPLRELEQDIPSAACWVQLFQNSGSLSTDILVVQGRIRSTSPQPWEEDWMRGFMVDEGKTPEERWEEVILMNRSADDIAEAAEDGCIRSIIENGHLNRRKE